MKSHIGTGRWPRGVRSDRLEMGAPVDVLGRRRRQLSEAAGQVDQGHPAGVCFLEEVAQRERRFTRSCSAVRRPTRHTVLGPLAGQVRPGAVEALATSHR